MTTIGVDTVEFRAELVAWLDSAELPTPLTGPVSLDAQMDRYRSVKTALWNSGLGRYGWPEYVGGLGGPALLRAIVGEEIATRKLADPGCWSMIETLAPTVVQFAAPELAAELVPPLLCGQEMWCQGFSEPGAGSDLASLSCRAVASDRGFVVNGQKIWTSYAQYSSRCVLLTRTGGPGSAHRGITALLVDMDSPGVSYHPIETLHGRHEFAEVFFDDVFVPAHRVLGEVGGGWKVAMDILPYERSTTFWHRGAHLLRRCADLVEQVDSDDGWPSAAPAALGEAYQSLVAFRMRSRSTQHRLAVGEPLGAETSVDKVLIAWAEQTLFDTARRLLPGEIELDADDVAAGWREDFLYGRAATIYGGTAEIQRGIIARRLLDLGPEA